MLRHGLQHLWHTYISEETLQLSEVSRMFPARCVFSTLRNAVNATNLVSCALCVWLLYCTTLHLCTSKQSADGHGFITALDHLNEDGKIHSDSMTQAEAAHCALGSMANCMQ